MFFFFRLLFEMETLFDLPLFSNDYRFFYKEWLETSTKMAEILRNSGSMSEKY